MKFEKEIENGFEVLLKNSKKKIKISQTLVFPKNVKKKQKISWKRKFLKACFTVKNNKK